MSYLYVDTAIGRLLVVGDELHVLRIDFPKDGRAGVPEPDWKKCTRGPVAEAARQLREYFTGQRVDFNLPLEPCGTVFQRGVWDQLLRIPYGETISYGELARRVGKPTASRAVGAANGKNPLPIVIPCHRVIGSSGALTGFGGGLPTKKALLALESRQRTLV